MRSLLFVPAKEKTIGRIGNLDADWYIVDLEDSILEEQKDEALRYLKDALSSNICFNNIIVRVNKNRYKKEIEALYGFNIGFMLPKIESPDDYNIDVQVKGDIIGLVETPKGIINLEKICKCHYLTAVAFGAEDFTASIGMENRIELLQYQKSKIVTCARAFQKRVYDTPSFQLSDYDAFLREVDNARALGFDGKMAIHPKHIDYINKTFSDSNLDVIEEIVREYDRCGEAVLMIGDKVYEKMHIEHFRKMLNENRGSLIWNYMEKK